MRLHLDRDRDEPLLWEETVELEPEALGPDLVLELGPIEVRGRVDRVDPDFQVAMGLRYHQALACTRCLKPVRTEVSTQVDLAVRTRPEGRSREGRAKEARVQGGSARGASAKSASAPGGPAKGASAQGAPARTGAGKRAPRQDGRAKKAGVAAEVEHELEKDELGVLVLDGEHLDTEPVIQEQVVLEIPMKPLCASECKGLCPRCGADRNLTPDCCAEPAGDERWEALGTLRDRLSADGR
jgi:uncharacterized metal-binding protein YceD (DUF177 family)